jgi:outer membrane PBP1 activator LpoA protein
MVAAALWIGCGRSPSETPSPTASPAAPAAAPAPAVAPGTTDAATAAASQAQSLIDEARAFLNKKDYQSALNVLNRLSALKLTPEQEKLVADLKAQAQKYLAQQATDKAAAEAGKALEGVFQK